MTYLFLTPVLAAGTVTDLRFRKVPNGVIGFGAAAGLAILTAERLSGDGGAAGVVFAGHAGLGIWQWLSMCGGYVLRLGLVCAIGFPLFLFRMMGAGDVKLMAVCGLLLGWKLIVFAFLLGCIIGSVIHLIRMKVSGEGHVLAMGPYLSAGVAVAVLWGNEFLQWYLGLYH